MKKYLLVIPIILSVMSNATAGIVDSASAVLAANNWYSLDGMSGFSVSSVSVIYFNGHPSRYVVDYNNNGFVMTSACNAENPILGFSTEHNFNTVNRSPELEFLLGIYDLTIDSLYPLSCPLLSGLIF